MKKIVSILLFNLLLFGLLQSQEIIDDFESGDFSQQQWIIHGNSDWEITNTDPYEGSYSAISGNIGHNQTSILELDFTFESNTILNYYWKVNSEESYDFLKFYLDDELITQLSGFVDWQSVGIDITSGEHNLKWVYQKDGSVTEGNDLGMLDKISFVSASDYAVDLSFSEIDLPDIVLNNTSFPVTSTIKNTGNTVINSLTISIYDSDDLLLNETSFTELLIPGYTYSFQNNLSINNPEDIIKKEIYAKVSHPEDQNTNNNQSDTHQFTIIPGDYSYSTIGDGETTSALIPINFSYNYSFSQTLFREEDFTSFGVLKNISLYSHFLDNPGFQNIKIWAKKTQTDNLADEWAQIDSAKILFDGEIFFDEGLNQNLITLEDTLHYKNDNLVITLERTFDTSFSTNNDFFAVEEDAFYSRSFVSNTTTIDHNFLQGGMVLNQIPKVSFIFEKFKYGNINGHVVDEFDAPIPYATIEIDNTNYSTICNSEGYYDFTELTAGEYNLIANHSDFQQSDQHFVEIEAGYTVTENITLSAATSTESYEIEQLNRIRINPNPLKTSNILKISFGLKNAQNVKIQLYNIKGKKISVITNKQFSSGLHTIRWSTNNTINIASGIYYLKFRSKDLSNTKKILFIK